MVKTPRTRHSKTRRAQVTLDLPATEVPEEAARQPDEIDVSIDRQPVEELLLDTAPEAEAVIVPELAKTPIEEPVEDRIETEAARTGAAEPPPASAYGRTGGNEAAAKPASAPGRGLSSLAGGLIGAAAALAAVLGLQWAGLLVAPGEKDPAPLIAPVQNEMAALKDAVAALGNAPSPDIGGLTASIDQVKADLAALQSANNAGGADAGALSTLDARINDLEGRLTAVADAAGKEDGRLAALEQSVAGLTGKLDQQASQPKVALAIAAAALKSALDRGGAFTAELETLAAIAPDAPELAGLRAYAQNGIASAAELSAEAGAAADAMIAAAAPVDPNAGIVDRLLSSARSMVRVRPVGEVAGEDVDARVARLEAAVKDGQYDRALSEFDALPDVAKAAGAAFAERLKARLDAMRLADQLVANAMKAA